ncbi:ABC transporter permease [Streptomyces sp. NPDC085946]|uniref:ABC transporter permease n=1 Tax=Streptomyces sp. NPDC085946 TaxID=3365744 RepID=UPI0037D2871F
MGERSRLSDGVRAYGLITGMWIRSSLAYRASFAMTVFGGLLLSGLDFVAILLMFSRVGSLGGYALPEVALLYGLSATSFGLADLAVNSLGQLGRSVRDGTLDTLLVRPAPVLAQAAADRFALRRVARLAQGALVLGYALAAVDVDWTAPRVLLVPVTLVSGAVIFGAVFVAGAALQILVQDVAEVQNAFTYGGTTLLQYPPTVFGRELVRGVTFVLPLAFVNWVPAAHLLGRAYPLGLPGWAAWAPPLVAAGVCVPAGLAWRSALRSYRSTGS